MSGLPRTDRSMAVPGRASGGEAEILALFEVCHQDGMFDLMVLEGDSLGKRTVHTCGMSYVSPSSWGLILYYGTCHERELKVTALAWQICCLSPPSGGP